MLNSACPIILSWFYADFRFINHAIYFGLMSPNPSGEERFPTGPLLDEIEETFGSYFAFKVEFSYEAVELFGSGTYLLMLNSNIS